MPIGMFFTFAAVVTGTLAVVWLFAPAFMLEGWGVTGDSATVYMGRRYGGMCLGYCVSLWLARTAAASPARRAIVAGGLVVTAVMALISLVGVLGGTIGPLAWAAVAVEALLAAGFGYYLATGRS